jgi:uncharacterized membrane protein required for colicin V production
MASSVLMIAVIVFAIRGFFLGFVGVIGKAIGLVLGYVLAISYRSDAAIWVSSNTSISSINLPSMIIEIGCGAALFFAALFTTGFVVSACAGLLKKMIPPLEPILNKDSTAGRTTGAISNALLGAAIVLIGIWIYAMMGKGTVEPPLLQQVANTFGNHFFKVVKQNSSLSLPNFNSPTPAPKVYTASPAALAPNTETTTKTTTGTTTGTAVIVSEANPDKKFSIESSYQQILETQGSAEGNDLSSMLGNEQLQALLNNPQVRQFAMEQIKSGAGPVNEISEKTGLSPEQLQQLLENLPLQQQ